MTRERRQRRLLDRAVFDLFQAGWSFEEIGWFFAQGSKWAQDVYRRVAFPIRRRR